MTYPVKYKSGSEIFIKNNVLETIFGRSSDPNYPESPFFHEEDKSISRQHFKVLKIDNNFFI